MNTFQSILLIIAILLFIEIILRLGGTTLTVIFKLIYRGYLHSVSNPVDFWIRTSITIMSLILIIVGWFIITKAPDRLDDYVSANNVILIVMLGLMLITFIGAYIWEARNMFNNRPIPGTDPVSKFIYIFWDVPRWIFSGEVGGKFLKIIIGIALVFAILIGSITVLTKYPVLSKAVFISFQVLLTLAFLFAIYAVIKNNPRLKELIQNSILFKLIYNLLFGVPCFLVLLINTIYHEVKNTPSIVFKVLLVELIIIGLYVASLFSKKLYELLYNQLYLKKSDLTMTKVAQSDSINDKLNEVTTQISRIKGGKSTGEKMMNLITGIFTEKKDTESYDEGLDIDWDYIVTRQLYLRENQSDLDLYLLGNGFKDETQPGFNPQVDKSMQKARSYIQVNGPILVKLLDQQSDLEDKIKEINNTKNEDDIETSKILLNKPKYLDKEKIIGTFNNLETDVGIYNYRYSISAWIFLHEEPPNFRTSSTKFTRLLSYAGNPEISFNLEKHMLKITVKKADGSKRVVYKNNKIPMQRWNNFVITNTGGTIDIFINGILVSSTPNTVPYMKYDEIICGKRNGVSGGICNVTYFSYPMSKRQVQFLYNNLKSKNPPII